MLLSHKTTVKLNSAYSNIVGHLCHAASKLWNVCNYERKNYKELGLEKYPDWYYQKSKHKEDMWFRSLPSQSAQEVCKLLDKSWKSFYALKKSGGIENPRPPRYKQTGIPVTYMQHAVVHEEDTAVVRLSLPKRLKEYMASVYDIHENYLFLENKIFRNMNKIKQIKLYPPEKDSTCRILVIYEVEDVEVRSDNGHYLSIDLGLHNLLTCYDSYGETFIVGRRYLSICQRYDKEIARVQSQWAKCQASKGVRYPKMSKHLQKLYGKKKNSVSDYLHKITRYIAEYCREKQINTCVIGNIKGIRKNKNFGAVTNQKLHALPYAKLYGMLAYKLAQYGISLKKQTEEYSSQCSPMTPEVSKRYAEGAKRIKRGLYQDGNKIYNADAVGAYNILRKYLAMSGVKTKLSLSGLKNVSVIKVAV